MLTELYTAGWLLDACRELLALRSLSICLLSTQVRMLTELYTAGWLLDACRELLALRSPDVSSKCSVYASAALVFVLLYY
jgi:hypothetical protein